MTMKLRSAAEHEDIAHDKKCICIPCFFKFTACHFAFYVHDMETLQKKKQRRLISDYADEAERTSQTKLFCETYGAQTSDNGKKWWLTRRSTAKFDSVTHMTLQCYNFADSLPACCLGATLPHLETTHGPFLLDHVSRVMFKNVLSRCRGIPERDIFIQLGARPVPRTFRDSSNNTDHLVFFSADTRNNGPTRRIFQQSSVQADVKSAAASAAAFVTAISEVLDERRCPQLAGDSYRTLPAGAQNLGHCGADEAGCVEGSIAKAGLIRGMQIAKLNETSTFLDIGCGAGEPLVIAKLAFNCRLAIGLEVMASRCAQTVRLALHNGCYVYPVHAQVEMIHHLAPATHVYSFMQGMNASVENAVKEAILRSSSVMYCILTKKILDGEAGFKRVEKFVADMSRSSGHTTIYVYRRCSPPTAPPSTRSFHPAFTIPIFVLRLPHHWQQGLLLAYVERLERSDYKPQYFCAVESVAD